MLDSSDSLIEFAYKSTRSSIHDAMGGLAEDNSIFAGMVYSVYLSLSPFVLSYYFITGPFLYKNKAKKDNNNKKLEDRI